MPNILSMIVELTYIQVATVWTPVPKHLRIPKGTKTTYRFITVIASNLEVEDPLTHSINIWKSMVSKKDLFTCHAEEWKKLWRSANITMKGNDYLAQITTSSLYYTLSQVRK